MKTVFVGFGMGQVLFFCLVWVCFVSACPCEKGQEPTRAINFDPWPHFFRQKLPQNKVHQA